MDNHLNNSLVPPPKKTRTRKERRTMLRKKLKKLKRSGLKPKPRRPGPPSSTRSIETKVVLLMNENFAISGYSPVFKVLA
jgi:hypothetical protein